MSQSTPVVVTKRKVMGRMDAGPAESPSSSVTPNARPRIVRAQHGYSSPALSNSATPTANRTAPGGGRARVDMSALASPSSVASSPAMSPAASSRPLSASSAGSATITARLSANSPSVRSTHTFHSRSGSTVGVSAASSRLTDARSDGLSDSNLASLRSPRIRARDGSIDLSASPSVLSPSPRIPASSQVAPSASFRTPLPRTDFSQLQKPSTPSGTTVRPATTIPARQLLSPQHSQEAVDRAAPAPKSRSPSPVLTDLHASLSPPPKQQTNSSKLALQPHQSELVVPDRQTSIPFGAQESARAINASNGSSAFADEHSLYAISPTEFRPIGNVGAALRLDKGSAMTTGRASLRPGTASQRAAMPPSFMDLASPSAPLRPTVEQRSSFASSTLSSNSVSQPLSPSSEAPRSPSETGEAEEARVHRKLLDLEITNKSLMAINSALEVTKLKQAKEIRELKRRLRDGRGLSIGPIPRGSASGTLFSDEEDLGTDSDEDGDDFVVREDPELEAAHQRCKDLVDNMVEQARQAILAEYDEPENTRGKVLHPAEIAEMQREMEDGNDTEADTTVATDAVETSMTFDRSSGDTSKDDGLSTSSSHSQAEGHMVSSPTSSNATNGLQVASPPLQLKQSRPELHAIADYGGNMPSHGDVSID